MSTNVFCTYVYLERWSLFQTPLLIWMYTLFIFVIDLSAASYDINMLKQDYMAYQHDLGKMYTLDTHY